MGEEGREKGQGEGGKGLGRSRADVGCIRNHPLHQWL